MKRLRVAVVGVGHRGLAVFDRILALASQGGPELEVLLVEPGTLGVGVHWLDQPTYLMLNTVASQATAFADPEMVSGARVVGGPTFLQWCRQQKIRSPDRGTVVAPDDFLPRRVWGQYLAWAADHLLARTPPNVSVRIHQGEARQVESVGPRATVQLDDGSATDVDLVFVTTGHGLRGPGGDVRNTGVDCYPLPDSVAHLTAGTRVAVSGMGLSGVDVIAALTVGRGGQFNSGHDQLEYAPSGREPAILLFSRHGRLPCARPSRPRTAPKTAAHHFTSATIHRLRESRPDGRLSFLDDVLPKLRAEMLDRTLSHTQRQLAESVLALSPPRFADLSSYRDSVVADAELDIAEAELGLEVSAFKEAMEVPRDLRQSLRDVVVEPGLTDAGHRDFFAIVPGLANRTAVGPQLERLREILALMRAGVVELGPGPDPSVVEDGDSWLLESTHLARSESIRVDALVSAHLVWPRAIGGRDPLRRALRKWVAPHPSDERYLHLDPRGRAYRLDGSLAENVVVLGPPAEGSNYYNNYVLWPGAPSPLLADVDHALGRL